MISIVSCVGRPTYLYMFPSNLCRAAATLHLYQNAEHIVDSKDEQSSTKKSCTATEDRFRSHSLNLKKRLFNVNVYIGVSRFVRRCAALNGVLYEPLYRHK